LGDFFNTRLLYKNSTKLRIKLHKGFVVTVFIVSLLLMVNTGKGVSVGINSSYQVTDSLLQQNDTIKKDSTVADSTKKEKQSITDPIKYSATDSLVFDWENKNVYLYNNAQVNYQNIELKSGYIMFEMNGQTVTATTIKDSANNETGKPNFKEGNEAFEAHSVRYNFKSKKGFITSVKTPQEGGVLHGDTTKRQANGHIHLKDGKYTTCDLDHPHFYIGLTKAKSVPGDKLVTGPAYLVMADIPLPIGVPFGFFPNTSTYSSGILLPTWGEDSYKGFYLRNGGYYFGISDYADLKLTGDIYTKGSWGANISSNYARRYRYRGSLFTSYLSTVEGEKGLPDYAVRKYFSIRWNQSQDAKANPNSTFSASVNYSTSGYDKRNSRDAESYLSNTKSSSISYSHTWPNSPFSLTSSINHSQNSQNKTVDLSLPSLSLNMNTVYPFRNDENEGGNMKWYENIQLSYDASLENNIHTYDSLLFTDRAFENSESGFKHSLPLSTNFKLNKFITLTPGLNYEGVLHPKYIEKFWDTTYINPTTGARGKIDTIEYKQFKYAQAYYPRASLSIAPKFYGMYMFKNSKIKAIRHVMSPSLGFSFIPDVRSYLPNYYHTVKNDTGKIVNTYSIFEDNLYGTPVPNGKSGSISFSLRNNLEMKYESESDTSIDEKKISLLDNLDFSTGYNVYADSMNLSVIQMNTGTSFFDKKLSIDVNASMDPYALNDTKTGRIKDFEWNKNNRLGRITSASVSLSTNFKSEAGKKEDDKKSDLETEPTDETDSNVNYDIPWSLNIGYSWYYSKQLKEKTLNQTFDISGDLSLTKKWKLGFRSGYDFESKKLSFTNINIARDLHCWEMRFNWIPFGYRQSYNFTINAKSTILRDLKYDKRKQWYDDL
jgi:hypothetical protein